MMDSDAVALRGICNVLPVGEDSRHRGIIPHDLHQANRRHSRQRPHLPDASSLANTPKLFFDYLFIFFGSSIISC